MNVTVLLFARAKELLRRDRVTLALPPHATVASLRSVLSTAYPVLGTLLPACVIAVNHEFADDARVLHSDDEIALIPPVSGG